MSAGTEWRHNNPLCHLDFANNIPLIDTDKNATNEFPKTFRHHATLYANI